MFYLSSSNAVCHSASSLSLTQTLKAVMSLMPLLHYFADLFLLKSSPTQHPQTRVLCAWWLGKKISFSFLFPHSHSVIINCPPEMQASIFEDYNSKTHGGIADYSPCIPELANTAGSCVSKTPICSDPSWEEAWLWMFKKGILNEIPSPRLAWLLFAFFQLVWPLLKISSKVSGLGIDLPLLGQWTEKSNRTRNQSIMPKVSG